MLNKPLNFPPKKRFSWVLLALWLSVAIFLTGYLVKGFPEMFTNQSEHIHLISLGLIFAYLSLVLLAQRFHFLETIKYLTVWLGIGLIILGIYSYRYQLANTMNIIGEEIIFFKSPERYAGSLTFPLNNKGHFMLEAIVEGVPIKFMLDTDATRVILTQADAKRLGLLVNGLSYTQPTGTAQGVVWSAPIRLQKIKIGSVSVSNVAASVSNSELEQSLLGMSFLEKIEGYEVQKGVLILKN
jgi:aspartyl protease family protein